jgi:hypothetical protein
MQQKLLNMMQSPDVEAKCESHLSFKPFLDHVRLRLQDETSIKSGFFRHVLKEFSAFPELEGNVPLGDLSRYKSLFDLLYVGLSTLVDDEKKVYWGMSVPMSPIVFYGSDLFYNLLAEANLQALDCSLPNETLADAERQKLEWFYSFILEKLYGIRFRRKADMVKSITETSSGLTRHFRVNLDTRFIDVSPKGELPVIDTEVIRSYSFEEDALDVLYRLLPPQLFVLSGFSIITITDVTAEYALQTIREHSADSAEDAFPLVVKALKELAGKTEIEFNILPLLRVNGKLVDDEETLGKSILFDSGRQMGFSGAACLSMIDKFVSDPKIVYFGDLESEASLQKDAGRFLHKSGIKAYALFPVYANNKLLGALEVYSREKGLLNEGLFALIEPAINMLSQLMVHAVSEFDEQIESVIKEKFTTLQPSVQWKFNEVAWQYLRKKKKQEGRVEPEEILFPQVYPLYGAVDIRNSTVERNNALQEDLKIQFEELLQVLVGLKEASGFGLLDEKIFQVQQWQQRIQVGTGFNQEIRLNDFLENEIMPFLKQFTGSHPSYRAIAQPYFDAIDENTGCAFEHRRQLESSMTTVISAVNNYFDLLKEEIQRAYPSYFEKFRTDGVEYDIYIGQSITPDKPYTDIYLKNLRLLQLSSMAAIARYSNALLPQLSRPVETTQLIFIHSHPIDIRFRRDEKRFDVEGAYNIRYHIIKKRIDKVRIRDTRERLTQPNKIALVYFNQKEADEYIGYIRYLQGEGMLLNDLEFLELEELQGVSGLKALRVGVNLAVSQ